MVSSSNGEGSGMALVNCYELVKLVLDDTYSAIEGTDTEKEAAVKEALRRLSSAYGKLTTQPGPDYSEPAARVGYVFRYVTSHANLVYLLLRTRKETRDLFDRAELSITCIGGGPGSDLLGVIKLLLSQESEKTPRVMTYICDLEKMWIDSWGDVGSKLPEEVRLHTVYCQQDVCDAATWKERKYLDADLFTMIYFMSELYSRKVEAAAYFENFFARAKTGALFLFIDNMDERFSGWFDDLATRHGVRILYKEDGERNMPGDEQESVLADYVTRFGGRTKLKTKIAARIGIKD
jgi:hypothetical protein